MASITRLSARGTPRAANASYSGRIPIPLPLTISALSARGTPKAINADYTNRALPSVSGFRFRRTLSSLGTRTGDRQFTKG